LVCIPDARETTIVKNVVQSVAFPKIEEELTKLKKQKIARCLAYTNVKVMKMFPLSFLIVKSKMQ
jgi:isopentenyl phosphate kinase